MLLDPFEKQFHTPAQPVQLGDRECRQCKVVREEYEPLAGFGVVELDAAQRCLEAFARVKAGEDYGLVADEPGGSVNGVRVATLCSEVRLGACNEEAAGVVEPGQSLEVDIGSVHNVEGTGLGHEVVENVDIMELTVADEDKRGNAATQIEQRVKLHSGFRRSEGCPGEYRKAQIDCGRVECVDRVLQLYAERFLGIEPSSDPNQALGEVAVDAPIARCVGVGKSVAGYIAADAEMIELRTVCSQAGLDIAQALSPCELRERHAQILVETGEVLDLVLTAVASNATLEGR